MRSLPLTALLVSCVAGAVSPVAVGVPEIQHPVALTVVAHVKGQVRLAWTEKNGNYQLHAAALSKNGWEGLGDVLNEDPAFNTLQLNRTPGSFTAGPRLILSPFGQPLVAWIEGGTDRPDRVFVSRWNGREWQRLGGALSAGKEMAETLTLGLGRGGQPRAAWIAEGKLRAATWVNNHWEPLLLPRTQKVTGVSLSEDGDYLSASVNGKLHLWRCP